MGHHDGGGTLGLTLPAEQEASVGEAGELAGLKDVRVKGGELGNELFKLGVVLQGGIHIGHGLALDQLAEGLHRGVPVDVHGGGVGLGLRLGLEGGGSDEDDRQEDNDRQGDEDGEGIEQQYDDAQSEPFVHIKAPLSCKGYGPRSR